MNREVPLPDVSAEENRSASITTAGPSKENADSLSINNSTGYCGFCNEELSSNKGCWEACSRSPEVFFKSLKFGRLRGIVNIAGCCNSEDKPGPEYEQLTRELIKRDILVTVSGCVASVLEKAGLTGADSMQWAGDGLTDICDYFDIQPVLCTGSDAGNADTMDFLKILAQHSEADINTVPMAAVIPHRYQEQAEISDTTGGEGGKTVIEEIRAVYGTLFSIGTDPRETADLVEEHIHNSRLKLAWCDRYHCSIDSYS